MCPFQEVVVICCLLWTVLNFSFCEGSKMNQILVLSAGSLQSPKGAASLYDQLCSSLYTSGLQWKFLLRLLVLTDWKL